MNKHLSPTAFTLSMFFLLLLGLGFLAGLYLFLNPNKLATPADLISTGPVTSEPVSLTLNLSSPNDNILVFDPHILVQGKTIPKAIVILSSNSDDETLNVDNDGNFSTTIKLKEGVNEIDVASFDNLGNSKEEKRMIYYSPEKV